jgi:hypothetical protein
MEVAEATLESGRVALDVAVLRPPRLLPHRRSGSGLPDFYRCGIPKL